VAPDSKLRTERRISHVYAMDLPAYPKPLLVTDAAINIAPRFAGTWPGLASGWMSRRMPRMGRAFQPTRAPCPSG
jgi:hypothetical protein